MGRLVLVSREGSMFQVLFCYWLVFVTLSSHSTTAADVDIYPGLFSTSCDCEELADEAILKRIQHVLTEWRQKQLRIQLQEPSEIIPHFTFHFPEDRNQNYQSDYFAVPPSDPRYYQQQPDESNAVDKSKEDDKRFDSNPLSESATKISETKGAEAEQVKSRDEESWTEDENTESPSTKVEEEDSIFIKKIFSNDNQDIILVAVIAGCGAAVAAGVVALSIGWYRLHTNSKAAADIEYPAYGVTGPNKEISPTGDRRLAQSAQMYHYQHQKQQIIAMENNRANNERRGSVSEGDSDEENEEGDYTVYECPGLAATGELEVKNPLFLDDPTPATGNKTCEESPAPAEKKQ